MAEIITLIRADHLRAEELFAVALDGSGGRTAPARAWAELAELLDVHVAAVNEICCLELMRHDPDTGGSAEALADRDDMLEAIDEARLCPVGGGQWQQVVLAARRASSGYFRWLDRGMCELANRLDAVARHELACQWRAFRRAWAMDGGTREQTASRVSQQNS